MKATYYILSHSRGNQSAEQVYYHGSKHFEGTKKECAEELVRMRKFCKEKFHNTSTNEKMRDFVSYEMADVFFIKVKDGKINWA